MCSGTTSTSKATRCMLTSWTGPATGRSSWRRTAPSRYTPNADWYGTDTFTYRAWDPEVHSNTATVTITVTPVNDEPVAMPDGTLPGQVAKLIADDGAEDDGLGGSVAVSGTPWSWVPPALTSARTTSQGAAYVFTRSGTTWSSRPSSPPRRRGALGYFGCLGGRLWRHLVVGALGARSARTGSGRPPTSSRVPAASGPSKPSSPPPTAPP